jgi:WD40 repeat protein
MAKLRIAMLSLCSGPCLCVCLFAIACKPTSAPTKFRIIGQLPTDVYAVAYHPQGGSLAALDKDGTITVFDVASAKQTLQIKSEEEKRGYQELCFSPDGKLLTTGSRSGEIDVWQMPSGKHIALLRGHTDAVLTVCFSPDGKLLASGGLDESVRVWNVTTGREIYRFHGHALMVTSLSFTPDGRTLVSASHDGTIKLWDVTKGKELSTLVGHRDNILGLAVTADGNTVVSAGRDRKIYLWDLATRQTSHLMKGHDNTVSSVVCSPTKRLVGSVGDDGFVKLWDIDSRKELANIVPDCRVWSISFSPDGQQFTIGCSDGTIRTYDVNKLSNFIPCGQKTQPMLKPGRQRRFR